MQTINYPANESETAVDLTLRRLGDLERELTTTIADRLGEGAIAEATWEFAGAIVSLLGRWDRLETRSPYRKGALKTALEAIERAISTAGAASLEEMVELDEPRAEVLLRLGRIEVGELIRAARAELGLSVRAAAREVGVTPGYLSQLESGLSRLPSDEVCGRLQGILGVDVGTAARAVRTATDELRSRARERRAHERRAPRPRVSLGPGADARVHAAASALIDDPRLLEAVEGIVRLPPQGQDVVMGLVRALQDAFPP